MATHLRLGDITVDVVLKDIKNVHLSVYPPAGHVRISAPSRMSLDTIRVFAVSKIGWIRDQQRKLRAQERETVREYLDRESHYVWGRRYLLAIIHGEHEPTVELTNRRLLLRVRRGTQRERMQATVEKWYRDQVKQAVPALIAKWEPVVGVRVDRFFVQRMKTKWGSCSRGNRAIRLNTDLARKPIECLEYIVVHEMVHLLEATHNARFLAVMDELMPQWRHYRLRLNQLPVRHEDWRY